MIGKREDPLLLTDLHLIKCHSLTSSSSSSFLAAIPLRPIIYKECEHISSRGQFPQFLLKSAGFGEKEKATRTLLTQVCRLSFELFRRKCRWNTLCLAPSSDPPYPAVHTSLMRRNGTCQEIRNCCDIHIPSKIIPLQNILWNCERIYHQQNTV